MDFRSKKPKALICDQRVLTFRGTAQDAGPKLCSDIPRFTVTWLQITPCFTWNPRGRVAGFHVNWQKYIPAILRNPNLYHRIYPIPTNQASRKQCKCTHRSNMCPLPMLTNRGSMACHGFGNKTKKHQVVRYHSGQCLSGLSPRSPAIYCSAFGGLETAAKPTEHLQPKEPDGREPS